MIIQEPVQRSLELLAPFVRDKAVLAVQHCNDLGLPVAVFETYRNALRQYELFCQGRTTPGKIVTNALPWESSHIYGLACDIAFQKKGVWSWDGDYAAVAKIFLEHGFETLKSEHAHFQILGGMTVKQLKEIAIKNGLQSVWIAVAKNIGFVF